MQSVYQMFSSYLYFKSLKYSYRERIAPGAGMRDCNLALNPGAGNCETPLPLRAEEGRTRGVDTNLGGRRPLFGTWDTMPAAILVSPPPV